MILRVGMESHSNRLYGLLTTFGAGPPPRIRPVANLLASSPPPDGLAAASWALSFSICAACSSRRVVSCANDNGDSAGRRLAKDARDVTGVAFASNANHTCADIDIGHTHCCIEPGCCAQGSVGVAGVVKERTITDGDVAEADGVVKERLHACSRVAAAGSVEHQRLVTDEREHVARW